ncbi:MAG: DUF4412 domain-containing protein [Bacteroidales bacterium]
MNRQFFLTISLLLLASNTLFAGWVIVQKTYDASEGAQGEIEEILYFQDDKVKMMSEDMATIFDLNSGEMYFINYQTRNYWTGTAQEMEDQVKAAMDEMIEQQLANVPEDKREEMRAMYKQMMAGQTESDAHSRPSDLAVTIEKTTEKSVVAGLPVTKYRVIVDGKLTEEVWLNTDAGIHNEFSVQKFYDFMAGFLKSFQNQETYKDQEAYVQMAKQGYPLKIIDRAGAYETITEVTSVEKKNLSRSDFLPPNDFSEQALTDMQTGFN